MKIRKNVDYTNKDYESFRQDMIVRLQQKIPEYTDTSESDFGIVLIELLAHGLDILSYYNDRVAREMFLDTAMERDSVVSIATNILGYEVKENTPSQFYQVFKIIPTDSLTLIPKGTQVKTATDAEEVEESIPFETIEDLYIPPECQGDEKDEEGNYLYQVLVEQGESHYNVILGTSTGEANQEFYVPSTGVIRDSIEVYVIGENGTVEKWERVPNFISSKTDDKHFTVKMLEDDVAVIKFGNGNSGKIPYPVEEGITVNYKVGGGSKGNVSPYTIIEFEDTEAGYLETFNPYHAYVSGVDKESLEELVINAPASLKTMWGAITTEDYADLIRSHKRLQDVQSYTLKSNPLNVYVVLLPHGYELMNHDSKLQLKRELESTFQKKKALGVQVLITWANIRRVDLHLNVTLDKVTSKLATSEALEQTYKSLYTLTQRKLGEGMYISDFIDNAIELEGVRNAYGYLTLDTDTDEQGNLIQYPEILVDKTDVLVINNVNIRVTGGV
nr:MAG TPA: baseplate wedge protein [Caudoviricetes sp.]